jgi:Icc protein
VFRIAQVSDTHLSHEKPFFIANFDLVAAALAARRPDLVVNTGDISLDGVRHEADLAAARAIHDLLPFPARFVPGNHDVGDGENSGPRARHASWRAPEGRRAPQR